MNGRPEESERGDTERPRTGPAREPGAAHGGESASGGRSPAPGGMRDPEAPDASPAEAPPDTPGRTRDADVWDSLARWRAARRPFVLATVIATRGFTPRKAAAHMLIAADGETVGTIGGGAIEREVIERAQPLFAGGGSATVERHLTQELGMCCGGEMAVFLEAILPAPRLYLFGAGYIAKPVAAIAAGCGFEVTVVDGRAEWATGERFPTSAVCLEDAEGFARALAVAPEDFVVIVTHDHALDQRLVQALIRKPTRFLGMIGSIPKQRKFALRLRARGFTADEIARLHTPLGLAIGAATPEEIAVSVVAQLIAVRRGERVEPGWVPPARAVTGSTAGVEAAEPSEEGETGGSSAAQSSRHEKKAARGGRPGEAGATDAPGDREVAR